MKKLLCKITTLVLLTTSAIQAQQFKTPVQEFRLDNGKVISIEASYTEIEIEEWSKNKVEIQGVMDVQGLNEEEAQNVFDHWTIKAEEKENGISISSSSSNLGNEYFFINNDKYLGNVMVQIPEISARVIDILDSVNFVLPKIEHFSRDRI